MVAQLRGGLRCDRRDRHSKREPVPFHASLPNNSPLTTQHFYSREPDHPRQAAANGFNPQYAALHGILLDFRKKGRGTDGRSFLTASACSCGMLGENGLNAQLLWRGMACDSEPRAIAAGRWGDMCESLLNVTGATHQTKTHSDARGFPCGSPTAFLQRRICPAAPIAPSTPHILRSGKTV